MNSQEDLWYTDGNPRPLKQSKNMYMFQIIDWLKIDVLHPTMTSVIFEIQKRSQVTHFGDFDTYVRRFSVLAKIWTSNKFLCAYWIDYEVSRTLHGSATRSGASRRLWSWGKPQFFMWIRFCFKTNWNMWFGNICGAFHV